MERLAFRLPFTDTIYAFSPTMGMAKKYFKKGERERENVNRTVQLPYIWCACRVERRYLNARERERERERTMVWLCSRMRTPTFYWWTLQWIPFGVHAISHANQPGHCPFLSLLLSLLVHFFSWSPFPLLTNVDLLHSPFKFPFVFPIFSNINDDKLFVIFVEMCIKCATTKILTTTKQI